MEATFDAVDELIILPDEAGAVLRCNRATGGVFQLGYSQIVGQWIAVLFLNGLEKMVEHSRTEYTLRPPHATII